VGALRTQLAAEGGMATIAFDVPGIGGSPAPLLPLPLPVVALLARNVLSALEIDQCDVIGLSWGGLLAQQLALIAPRRVRRLVLANTTFGLGALPAGPGAIRTLLTTRRYRTHDGLREAKRHFGGAASGPSDQHSTARLARPPSMRGYYWQIISLAGWSSLPLIRLVRQPSLVLCGDDDAAIRLVNPRILGRLLPHAELVVVPEGGHLMMFERTEEIAPIIAGFLAAEGRDQHLRPRR